MLIFFNTKIAQANLITKTDFDVKLSALNRKITSNKTKYLLIGKELSYLHGKSYFDEDGTQNHYIFLPIPKYLKVSNVNDIEYILSSKSIGLNNVEIESIKRNNYLLNPRMDIYNTSKIRLKFNRSFLNRVPPTILHGNIVNIYIVYEIISDYNDSNYPTW